MGVVWRARDEVLGEDVALKFLPDAVRWDPGAYDDLKGETRRARQLTHANIVRIHDFAEDAGSVAISMELVVGATLTALRLAKPDKVFEPADILPWLPQLCAALDYAHTEARVVHRDLKPTNVMLTHDGRLKVADFGVARSMTDSISRVSMMAAGTLVYMSPQQAMGEDPSPADDIYALGATLYELLTGKPPFHTGDVRTQLFQRMPDSITARRRALGLEAGGIPDVWETTIAACLAKDSKDRPRCAGDVAAQLGAATDGAAAVRKEERSRPGPGAGKRWRPVAGLAAVAAGLAAWLFWPDDGAATSPDGAVAFASDATRALAAWNFDGDAGDGSGRGFDGRFTRTVPTLDRHGRIDRALHFNGNAEVVVDDTPLLRWGGAQPFTAAVWARRMESYDGGDAFWRFGGDGVETFTWGIGFQRGRPTAFVARVHSGEVGTDTHLFASQAIAAGEWCHLALVSDGTTATLFVDGRPAATERIGVARGAPAPKRAELRFGRPNRLAVGAFAGELDDARLWRRALSATEMSALAEPTPPPRFALSQGSLFDSDDFAAALRNEFGPGARLADWDDLRRIHADDTRAWADELGFAVGGTLGWVQRGGQRTFDGQRHYLINRFDGTKPSYYLAHDELGGMLLTLGSWYGVRAQLLASLPASRPQRRTLVADAAGIARSEGQVAPNRSAFALVWRAVTTPAVTEGVSAELRLRDHRRLAAVCRTVDNGALAIALTDSTLPSRTRQIAAANVELEFTLAVFDGAVRFRAVSVVGGNLVFEERISPADLRVADVVGLEIRGLAAGGAIAQGKPATAELIIE